MQHSDGFTLIELLVVVSVIGIITAAAVGTLRHQIEKATVTAVARDLETFETGFVSFASVNGDFPSDSHLDDTYHLLFGEGVEDYLPVERWAAETPLGGYYDWEGPDHHPYAAVAFFQPVAPSSTFALLDAKIDDGDLSQGRFRITGNGRYTYIIDE